MIPWRRTLILLLIAALSWQGVLLTLPHDHDQAGVPHYLTRCALAGTISRDFHLHQQPQPLPAAHCLACLAGHVLPLFRGSVTYAVPTPAARAATTAATRPAVWTGVVLPGRRGPPASA